MCTSCKPVIYQIRESHKRKITINKHLKRISVLGFCCMRSTVFLSTSIISKADYSSISLLIHSAVLIFSVAQFQPLTLAGQIWFSNAAPSFSTSVRSEQHPTGGGSGLLLFDVLDFPTAVFIEGYYPNSFLIIAFYTHPHIMMHVQV